MYHAAYAFSVGIIAKERCSLKEIATRRKYTRVFRNEILTFHLYLDKTNYEINREPISNLWRSRCRLIFAVVKYLISIVYTASFNTSIQFVTCFETRLLYDT